MSPNVNCGLWILMMCQCKFISCNEYISLGERGSVQFSCSVVSDSLRPHESQHGRPPCPSPTPRVYPNSCPSSRWCHPTISSSVIPFASCLQSQHQGLFKWVSSSHQVAKVLEFQVQSTSVQNMKWSTGYIITKEHICEKIVTVCSSQWSILIVEFSVVTSYPLGETVQVLLKISRSITKK